MRYMNMKLEVDQVTGLLAALQLKQNFVNQSTYTRSFLITNAGEYQIFLIKADGVIVNEERVCVPNVDGLQRDILWDAHNAPYAIHPGTTKMYRDLKPCYWWQTMKTHVVEFVATCMTCQQVKAEHQTTN
ncbi:UNVERIFIED_CONTAM: hypothetical protein Sradi_6430400, partial [Sesamum radiatum]